MSGVNEIRKPESSTWTDDQWRAIVTGGRNVLVAAAAGSGKTAVLVERIIRKIAADTDVDRLLVATFTKAAASEMKERIRVALERELERNPDSDHLRRQLTLINRAAITTLHSFCLDVIRRHYPLIGLDPGFRIANETEAELMRMDTLDQLFEDRYASAGEEDSFLRLADEFGGERGDEPLYRLVQELYDFSRSHPWPDDWLRRAAEAFRVTGAEALESSGWVACLGADVRMALEAARSMLEQAMETAEAPGGPHVYAETFRADLDTVGTLAAAVERQPWRTWHEAFRAAEFGKLKAMRGDGVDKGLQEQAKALRDAAKSIVADMADELFGRSPDEFLAELWHAAPQMEALAELVLDFGRRYEAAKRSRGLLDFGDLEHYCLRILRDPASTPERTVPSAAAEEFRRQFEEILLDEYQDTNMVQEAIVELIAREDAGNRFMVGDVKQSIYRFRLAEPNLFLRKYKAYRSGAAADAAAPVSGSGDEGLRIDLARNFRSRQEVVDGVNDVFRAIMHEAVAEMNYGPDAELVCGAAYPPAETGGGGVSRCSVDFVLLDRSDAPPGGPDADDAAAPADDGEEEDLSAAAEAAADLQAAQLEARWIAARIRALTEGGGGESPMRVHDPRSGASRALEWRDIVILLRATAHWAPLIIEELQMLGIPAYAELSSGYFDATEVQVVLSLLHVIDNPYQDIPLAGVLRSPIFRLTAEELAQIRIYAGKGPFYEAVVRASAEPLLQEATRRKLETFRIRLESWRDEARMGSLADLLWRIYRETGYYDLVGGHPGGVQRQANLRALHDRARQYEATSFRGLFRFLRFIERMRESGGDLGSAGALGEQENVVRIMSIHKSKGLEFPVVFVAGLGKAFNMRDLNGSFLLHKELGFGPKHVDGELRVSYPTLPYLALRRRMRMEMLAEEMRILYVAMTRPKEKLILLGTAPNAAKEIARWSAASRAGGGRLPDYHLASARRFLDWLMPLVVGGASREEGLPQGEPAVRGWRFGVAPAAGLVAEAAAAAETDEAAEALRRYRLDDIASLTRVEGGGFAEEIGRRLGWSYPHQAAAAVAAKTSVTEMKRLHAEAAADDYTERLEEKALDELSAAAAAGGGRPASAGTAAAHAGAQTGMSAESAAPAGVPDATRRPGWQVLPEPAAPESGAPAVRSAALGPADAYSFRLRRPRFMEQVSMTAAERGTASHLFMQFVPLAGPKDAEALGATLQEMIDRRLLSPKQAAAVDIAAIAAFFAGELGRRLLQAAWVRREVPFNWGVPAGRIHAAAAAGGAADEPVLIQGVVDCLFEDEGGLVLLDYKTDRIRGDGWDAAAERHRFQLELYAEAVGRILGRKIGECHVFFFDGGRSVRLV